MNNLSLTIKELTDAVGGDITPRMVRHYHQLGLLPQPERSPTNYRLYSHQDVQRLRRIVALKQQGFQLSHIRKLLETGLEAGSPENDFERTESLMRQLQQQYRAVTHQIAQLRQTAAALEGLLGRDQHCQNVQAEALSQLKLLEAEAQSGLGSLETLWSGLDAQVHAHPENFEQSLRRLLPDLSDRSEIEVDLLTQLVVACGDVTLVPFVRVGPGAIAVSRDRLQAQCSIVTDVPGVLQALDQPRLVHLGCATHSLIDDPHVTDVTEAERAFWQNPAWKERIAMLSPGCIAVVGYAPSVLLALCEAVEQKIFQPALIIGMPIGFSHAPAAKRRLIRSGVPFITVEGTMGGGLLAAIALNALARSLIEKPNCHCYLKAEG